MIQKLKHIAKISFGFQATTGANGGVKYLQAKDFNNFFNYQASSSDFIEETEKTQKGILTAGDVLFTAKGFRFFATVVEPLWPKAVASTLFFVIKVNQKYILPEYLAIILNLPASNAFFRQSSSSSTIPSIRIKELMDFEIVLPNLNEQLKIVKFNNTCNQELQLLETILTQKRSLYSNIIQKIIK